MRLFLIFIVVLLVGCQATSSQKKEDALKVRSLEETQSAVDSLKGAVTPTQAHARYCPVCGKRFSPSVTQCPFDQATLKEVE